MLLRACLCNIECILIALIWETVLQCVLKCSPTVTQKLNKSHKDIRMNKRTNTNEWTGKKIALNEKKRSWNGGNPRREINHVFILSLSHRAVVAMCTSVFVCVYYINDCLSCCLVGAAIWRDLWDSDCVRRVFFSFVRSFPLLWFHTWTI